MASESLEDIDRVVHQPDREFVESTNVWEFMQAFDINDYEELIDRTTRADPGEPASGVDWFWDAMTDYLDVEFYEPYDRVRDDSGARKAPEASSAEQSSASSRTGEARETTAEPSPSPREDGDQPRDVAWAEEAIETAHVATVPGSAFGTPGWVRLAYANSEDRLREGVERLAEHDLL